MRYTDQNLISTINFRELNAEARLKFLLAAEISRQSRYRFPEEEIQVSAN